LHCQKCKGRALIGRAPVNVVICRCEESALAAFVPCRAPDALCCSECDPASARAQGSCAPVFYDSSLSPSTHTSTRYRAPRQDAMIGVLGREARPKTLLLVQNNTIPARRLHSLPGKHHIAAPAPGGTAACTGHSRRHAAESARDACLLPRYARSESPESGQHS